MTTRARTGKNKRKENYINQGGNNRLFAYYIRMKSLHYVCVPAIKRVHHPLYRARFSIKHNRPKA